MKEFQPGDKVVYEPPLVAERGIVKSCRDGIVFVVFNCGGDWENYTNYTAVGCRPETLKKGWR